MLLEPKNDPTAGTIGELTICSGWYEIITVCYRRNRRDRSLVH